VGATEKWVVVAAATLLFAVPGAWGVITASVHGGEQVVVSIEEYMDGEVHALHLALTGCTLVFEHAMGTYTETGKREDYQEFYVPVAPHPGYEGRYRVILHVRDRASLKKMEPMLRGHGWAGITDPDAVPVAENVTLEGAIRWGVETLGGDHGLIEGQGGLLLDPDWVILEQFAEPKIFVYVVLLVVAGVLALGGSLWVIGFRGPRGQHR